MNKKIAAFVVCLLTAATATAQVGINNPTPDQSAVLDLSSTSKGLLIPRMNAQERAGIQNPALGLMVYQTDGQQGFWYYMQPGGWTFLNPTGADNLGNHTATQNLAMGTHKVTRASSGNADLLPAAHGIITSIGTIHSSTGNFTVSKFGTGIYIIAFDAAAQVNTSTDAFNITLWGDQPGFATGFKHPFSGNHVLFVQTYQVSGLPADRDFCLVMYKN